MLLKYLNLLLASLILVSLQWVGEDLIPFVPFISIIVVRAFIVSDIAFAVRDTVAGTCGMCRLNLVHCSPETIVAFYISAPNICDACISTQKWFQTVAGISGDAQRRCGHSGGFPQRKRSQIWANHL